MRSGNGVYPANGYFDRDNNDKPWELGLLSVGAGNVLLHQHGHVVNHAHHLTTTRASLAHFVTQKSLIDGESNPRLKSTLSKAG